MTAYYLGGKHQRLHGLLGGGGLPNSIGSVSSGGAGYGAAAMDETRRAPFRFWEGRYPACSAIPKREPPLSAKSADRNTGSLYADHFPYRQMATSRGHSPFAVARASKGARCCLLVKCAGWSGAQTGLPNEARQRNMYITWEPTETVPGIPAPQHMALLETVGPTRHDAFGRIEVEGRDALIFLQADVRQPSDVSIGRSHSADAQERGGSNAI